MAFCDICGKRLDAFNKYYCTFENQTIVTTKYRLCPECKTQVEKFIKFQSFRNTEEDDWK